MAEIHIRPETEDVARLAERLANVSGRYDWITARAMTMGVKASREQIRAKIFPMIQGGPTRWTERGLIARFASPDDLRASVGFNYDQAKASKNVLDKLSESGQASFKGGGVPSGRYMEINASGGGRNPKSFELELRRSNVLNRNAFIVPNKNLNEIDQHGNLPGPMYTQIGSRIGALFRPGSTQNAPKGAGSRGRTAAKRRVSDYFVMTENKGPSKSDLARATRETGGDARLARFLLGGQRKALFIARRVGLGGRGFEPVIWFKDSVKYQARFPIQSVAFAEFKKVFPIQFEEGVLIAIKKR